MIGNAAALDHRTTAGGYDNDDDDAVGRNTHNEPRVTIYGVRVLVLASRLSELF